MDLCPSPPISIAQDPPAGTLIGLDPTPVLLSACDSLGNCSYCMVLVTGIDITPPVMACPPDITIPTDPGQCTGSVELAWLNDSFMVGDNCPLPELIPKPDCTWEPVPKGLQFHVLREEHPRFCHWMRLEQHWQGGAIDQFRLVDLVTGEIAYLMHLRDLWVGLNPIEVRATDASGNTGGNCIWLVTVMDMEPPRIICTDPTVIAGCDGMAPCPEAALVIDNCPGVTWVQDPPVGTLLPLGVHTVMVVATDAVGNTSSEVCRVTVALPKTLYFERPGWHLIAQPHHGDHALRDTDPVVMVSAGDSIPVPFCDAVYAGWLQSPLYYWDDVGGTYLSAGCDPWDDDHLRHGKGYWLMTYVPMVTMVFP